MSRRDAAQIVVIWWRDIPTQVNGQVGRERHQVVLDHRFQRAVDRAAMKAGLTTADDYVRQVRRVSTPCDGDLVATANAEAARLEAAYSEERLKRLGFLGGYEEGGQDNQPEE